jgi:hypothetical protein
MVEVGEGKGTVKVGGFWRFLMCCFWVVFSGFKLMNFESKEVFLRVFVFIDKLVSLPEKRFDSW